MAGLLIALRARLQQLLPVHGFAHQVVILAGGAALGQGLTMLASPLLTRLYTPDDLGALSVYVSILSIAGVAAALRYELAIPLPPEDDTAANLLLVAVAALLGVSLLAATGLGLWGDRIVLLIGIPALQPYLWLVPLSLLALGMHQVVSMWSLRCRAYSRIAITKLSQTAGTVLAQLGLGLLCSGPLGLLAGDVVGRIGGAGTLAALSLREERASLSKTSLRGMAEAASRYRRFPIFSGSASLLNTLGTQFPLLFMASLYGAAVMGWLALAQRLTTVPLQLIASSAAQVYLAEAAKVARSEPRRLLRLFKGTIGAMLVMALPYLLIIALLGPTLFALVFGGAWQEAAIYSSILAPMVLLQNLASPVSGTVDVLERQDLDLLCEVVRITFMVGAVGLTAILHLDARTGIALYSGCGMLGYLFLLLVSALAIRATTERAPDSLAG